MSARGIAARCRPSHVDGSARVQTVSPSDNREFHALLEAVGKTTGREMVLNTSFNVKGQPIVNTPREAIETFLNTGIEFLFLEDTLVARRDGGHATVLRGSAGCTVSAGASK